MPVLPLPGLDQALFKQLSAAYRASFDVRLCVVNDAGRLIWKDRGWPGDNAADHCQSRELAVTESLRWGDPAVMPGPGHVLIWAVPLMLNAKLVGGLLAAVAESTLFPGRSDKPAIDIRLASAELRLLAERHNLTNASLLEMRRAEYLHEQKRAEAIHSLKLTPHFDIRRMYLREEPDLIDAIRRSDLSAARGILNTILVGMHHHAADRFDLIKSLFMELVAMACRTAVEAGGDPQQLLGTNYVNIAALSKIESMEELAPWLHEMLQRIIAAIHDRRTSVQAVMVAGAVSYMQQHLSENISRDEVAGAVHMSPSHFSRRFRQHTGLSFSEMLTKIRIRHAMELLSRTDKPIGEVACLCGFRDQSYFTKAFNRVTNMTPRLYREGLRRDA